MEKWREKDFFQHGSDWHEYLRMGDLGSEERRDNGKGDGQNEVDEGKGVSTMNLGAKMDCCTQDLVGSGWKQDVLEAAERERKAEVGDNSGTTEKPGNGDRPCSSDEFTSDAIQNPSIQPIRTASEWDPGPYK